MRFGFYEFLTVLMREGPDYQRKNSLIVKYSSSKIFLEVLWSIYIFNQSRVIYLTAVVENWADIYLVYV